MNHRIINNGGWALTCDTMVHVHVTCLCVCTAACTLRPYMYLYFCFLISSLILLHPPSSLPPSLFLPSIDPNLKSIVYGVGIAYGTVEDWDYLWNWYNQTDDPYEKRLCLRALAESREPWILSRYQELCIETETDFTCVTILFADQTPNVLISTDLPYPILHTPYPIPHTPYPTSHTPYPISHTPFSDSHTADTSDTPSTTCEHRTLSLSSLTSPGTFMAATSHGTLSGTRGTISSKCKCMTTSAVRYVVTYMCTLCVPCVDGCTRTYSTYMYMHVHMYVYSYIHVHVHACMFAQAVTRRLSLSSSDMVKGP